jgi:RimJ/RimL family protein N-acetyltransferase
MPTIERITRPQQFARHDGALAALIRPHLQVLLDDFSSRTLEEALLNLRDCVPHLWLAFSEEGRLVAGASLTEVMPGRHAFLHGVGEWRMRRSPMIPILTLAALDTAFTELGVLKVKAAFETDNLGATGFCRRFGFRREALFKADNRVNGVLKDVAVYSLPATDYHQRLRPLLLTLSQAESDAHAV